MFYRRLRYLSFPWLPSQLRRLWRKWAGGSPEVSRLTFSSVDKDDRKTNVAVVKLANGSFRWAVQSESDTPEVTLTLELFKALTVFISGEEIKK